LVHENQSADVDGLSLDDLVNAGSLIV